MLSFFLFPLTYTRSCFLGWRGHRHRHRHHTAMVHTRFARFSFPPPYLSHFACLAKLVSPRRHGQGPTTLRQASLIPGDGVTRLCHACLLVSLSRVQRQCRGPSLERHRHWLVAYSIADATLACPSVVIRWAFTCTCAYPYIHITCLHNITRPFRACRRQAGSPDAEGPHALLVICALNPTSACI